MPRLFRSHRLLILLRIRFNRRYFQSVRFLCLGNGVKTAVLFVERGAKRLNGRLDECAGRNAFLFIRLSVTREGVFSVCRERNIPSNK